MFSGQQNLKIFYSQYKEEKQLFIIFKKLYPDIVWHCSLINDLQDKSITKNCYFFNQLTDKCLSSKSVFKTLRLSFSETTASISVEISEVYVGYKSVSEVLFQSILQLYY